MSFIKFGIEDLDRVLFHKNIKVTPVVEAAGEFNRVREFIIDGKVYMIVWYINVNTLYIGDVEVKFRYVKQEKTWPNRAKMNLQFYDARGEVCCIIPIDKWED